jgi:hypothetical protein
MFGWSPPVLAPLVTVYDIWLIVLSGEIYAYSKLAYVSSKDDCSTLLPSKLRWVPLAKSKLSGG